MQPSGGCQPPALGRFGVPFFVDFFEPDGRWLEEHLAAKNKQTLGATKHRGSIFASLPAALGLIPGGTEIYQLNLDVEDSGLIMLTSTT